MDVLGFPLEALLFDHYSLTTVRSFWASIAVLTAAFSFWRITAVSSRARHKSGDRLSFQDPTTLTAASSEPDEPQKTPSDLTPPATPKPEAESPAVCSVSDNVVRKGGKFAAYYCEEDDSVADEEDGVYERYDGVYGEDDGVDERDDGVYGEDDGVYERYDGVYGEDDGVDERYDGVSGEEEGVVGKCNGVSGGIDGVWPFRVRAGMPVVRTGDFGWYRGQDLTVINGSVVKFWDGARRRTSPLRRAW